MAHSKKYISDRFENFSQNHLRRPNQTIQTRRWVQNLCWWPESRNPWSFLALWSSEFLQALVRFWKGLGILTMIDRSIRDPGFPDPPDLTNPSSSSAPGICPQGFALFATFFPGEMEAKTNGNSCDPGIADRLIFWSDPYDRIRPMRGKSDQS